MLLCIALLAASFVNSLAGLFGCLALAGAATSVHVHAASKIQQWFAARRGLATGVSMAGSGCGNFVYALALGAFLGGSSNTSLWREALRWEALLTACLAFPASLLLR